MRTSVYGTGGSVGKEAVFDAVDIAAGSQMVRDGWRRNVLQCLEEGKGPYVPPRR
jgi:hypothetical protein